MTNRGVYYINRMYINIVEYVKAGVLGFLGVWAYGPQVHSLYTYPHTLGILQGTLQQKLIMLP